MTRIGWIHWLAWVCLGVLVTPAIWPYVVASRYSLDLIATPEWDRWLALASQTLSLVLVTVILAVPLAVALATVLRRADRSSVVDAGLFLAMTIPLSVTTVAWHTLRWGRWSPFGQGPIPAACLHAIAGLPWVTLIVLQGFRRVEPALADDARLLGAPARVFWRLEMPRIVGFVGLGSFWLAAQVASEIVITDMLQVRTFAEELYTQVVAPTVTPERSIESIVGRATLVTLPVPLVFAAWAALLSRSWTQRLPGADRDTRDAGRSCRGVLLLACLAVVPMALLIGRLSTGPGVSLMLSSFRDNHWLISSSLLAALVTGLGVSSVVAVVSGLVRTGPALAALVAIATFVAACPGPIIGLGTRSIIDILLRIEDAWGGQICRQLLYDGPSILPVMMAWAARAWPLALAVWLPAVRRLPREFTEATRLETPGLGALFRHELWPTLRSTYMTSTGLVAAFCLGEVSASRIVATPGGQTFAHDVFARMHFGITPELAALCVLLSTMVGCVAIGTAWLGRRRQIG